MASDATCQHCSKPLPATARRHARFCSPAHRAAHHRASTAPKRARVRFLEPVRAGKASALDMSPSYPTNASRACFG
jgi:hypothetical protein